MSHVLVVEDDAPIRECLGELLDWRGHSHVLAPNGREAWMSLYEALPDLIILDLLMPEMDGLTFLRQLREHHHWNRIPVIVLTGQGPESSTVRKARELGVSHVFHKGSADVVMLMDRVEDMLATPARQPVGV